MKKTIKLSFIATMLAITSASMMFYSCNEDPDGNEPSGSNNEKLGKGYYVLCEGLWGKK